MPASWHPARLPDGQRQVPATKLSGNIAGQLSTALHRQLDPPGGSGAQPRFLDRDLINAPVNLIGFGMRRRGRPSLHNVSLDRDLIQRDDDPTVNHAAIEQIDDGSPHVGSGGNA